MSGPTKLELRSRFRWLAGELAELRDQEGAASARQAARLVPPVDRALQLLDLLEGRVLERRAALRAFTIHH